MKHSLKLTPEQHALALREDNNVALATRGRDLVLETIIAGHGVTKAQVIGLQGFELVIDDGLPEPDIAPHSQENAP